MHILEYENYKENKKHYDSDFSYNTYLCSIPKDFPCVPLHWHNEVEIIYIKKGSAKICVDGELYLIHNRNAAIILPGVLHSIEPLDDAVDPVEYENIIFDINILLPKQGDTMSYGFFTRILYQPANFPTIIDENSDCHKAILRCLDQIDSLRTTYPAGYYLGIKGWLYQIFFILESNILSHTSKYQKTCSFSEKYNSLTRDKLKLITDFIEKQYQQKITIEKMAELCGFSQSHFMKFFKQHMGKPFIEYVNDYRLIQAARLLKVSDDDVLAIALECGFENASYFNRLFLRKYGVTPTVFRRS